MFLFAIFHFHFSLLGFIIFIIGFLIGIVALYYNPPSNINIRPDKKQGCRLVTNGIYNYIRHPMYLSVILMTFSLVLFYRSIIEFVLWIVVVINMLLKLLYEEKIWQNDECYIEYMKKTYRLIPFIF
jgi:protein-S-isoprenylcysteine O-methyltransferase Ste14